MSCSPSQVEACVREQQFGGGSAVCLRRHGVHDLPEHVFFNVGADESDDLLARTAGLNSQPPRGPRASGELGGGVPVVARHA